MGGYIHYTDSRINEVNFEESSKLFWLILIHLYDIDFKIDNIQYLLELYFKTCEKNPIYYKELMSEYKNADKDTLYDTIYNIFKDDIDSYNKQKRNNDNVYLALILIKITVVRLSEWFLITKRDL